MHNLSIQQQYLLASRQPHALTFSYFLGTRLSYSDKIN